MNLPPLTFGTLVERYQRFLADVILDDGREVTAHVPNTGSMMSTREPGSRVGLSHHPESHRKLQWTLEIIQPAGCSYVGVNTMMPNRVVEESIRTGRVDALRGYDRIRREVRYGESSRVDLLLEKGAARCYIEVKNVTYKEGKRALFPDAVTSRGTRHLEELRRMVEAGHRGVIFFFVNRKDCTSMAPADRIDPLYGETLRAVLDAGVEALAYRFRVSPKEIVVDRKIPIVL